MGLCILRLKIFGFRSVEEFLDRCVDWEMNVDPDSEKIWKREKRVFKENENVEMVSDGFSYLATVVQSKIFHDMFDGEEWRVKSRKTLEYENDERPKAALVWNGSGTVNAQKVEKNDEFLITPGAKLNIAAETELKLYIFFPMLE